MGQKDSILCYYLVAPQGSDRDMQDALGLKVSQFVALMGDKTPELSGVQDAQRAAKAHIKRCWNSMTRRKQMIGFEHFPSPARKPVFQGIAEKMTLFRMKDADFRQKVSKVSKKFEKGIDRRPGLRYNNRAVSASD